MTAADVLSKLEAVKSRGPGRWSARCPAHADRSPSLSIRETDDRLLVHCWSGCTSREIVTALNISLRDLFHDDRRPLQGRRIPPRAARPQRLDRTALAFTLELAALDRRLRAERVLTAATHFSGDALTDQDRDRLMNAVANAYASTDYATILEDVAEGLRQRLLPTKGALPCRLTLMTS